MSSFWECDRLFFEDLPTVRDLIWSADWDILSREVSNYYKSDGTDDEAVKARAALEEMMNLETRPPSDEWLFLPMEYYQVSGAPEAIDRYIDAALIRRRDFKVIEEMSSREKLLYTARDCRKSLKREAKRYGKKYPNLYGWASRSWAKTLSVRVWMQGDFSRKERYQVLGSIVREMMSLGDTWEQVREMRQMLKEDSKKNKKAREVMRVKVHPLELLVRNFGLESSTDDYESEYYERLKDTALVFNHNASVDLHRRVVGLLECAKRAERDGKQPRSSPAYRW